MGDPGNRALLGKWISDPLDRRGLRRFGPAAIEFTDDGWLIHTIQSGGRAQEALLSYRVQGDLIVTDQPGAVREERTRFHLSPEGKLVLMHGRDRATYVRAG